MCIRDRFNGTFYQSILTEPYISKLLLSNQTLPERAASTDLDTYWHPEGSYPLNQTPTTPEFITLPGPNSSGGKIPVGFRIKGEGITVASFLDQVTFINPQGEGEEPEPT